MNIGAIIFSRLSSKRLPGKALIDISGRSLLGRVIDRTKDIDGIDTVLVATSLNPEDDEIEKFSSSENVSVYRGSLNNVFSRASLACKEYNLERFVRICGDRPFFSPKFVSELIQENKFKDFDLITNTFPRTFPPGLTCEIIKSSILEATQSQITLQSDKEHLTSYFYRNAKNFSIKNIYSNIAMDRNFDNLNLCVDTEKDLQRATYIASEMDTRNLTYDNIRNVISLAKEWDDNSSPN
jgi:spore coat polysaccharide biosynthesis protein SpsF